jgi:pimeloyl-ACP methyl ester carboxylesterase
VVQRYLERHPAPGAVLLASVPPTGMLLPAARLAARHPLAWFKVNLLLSLRPLVSSSALVRELFFTPETPQALVDDTAARLQDESWPAVVDTMVLWAHPRRVRVPVLVLGAERDRFFTAGEVRRTAAAYRARAEIVPAIGHNMMLDDGWEKVADRVDAWTQEVGMRGRPGMLS